MGSGSGRRRGAKPRVAGAVMVPILWAFCALATGCGQGGGSGSSSEAACAARVVEDWKSDGRVDGIYAGGCYVAALASLPEDVRTYSSAADDISRALQARENAATSGSAAATEPSPREPERRLSSEEATALALGPDAARSTLPAPIVAIAAVSAAIAAIAMTSLAVKRGRRRR